MKLFNCENAWLWKSHVRDKFSTEIKWILQDIYLDVGKWFLIHDNVICEKKSQKKTSAGRLSLSSMTRSSILRNEISTCLVL